MIFWKKKDLIDADKSDNYPIKAIPGDKVKITLVRVIEMNETKTFNNFEDVINYWRLCCG